MWLDSDRFTFTTRFWKACHRFNSLATLSSTNRYLVISARLLVSIATYLLKSKICLRFFSKLCIFYSYLDNRLFVCSSWILSLSFCFAKTCSLYSRSRLSLYLISYNWSSDLNCNFYSLISASSCYSLALTSHSTSSNFLFSLMRSC